MTHHTDNTGFGADHACGMPEVKTDVQKALDIFDGQDERELDFCYEGGSRDAIFVAKTMVRMYRLMLKNPEKLNTSEKHVNETANNEHVLNALNALQHMRNHTWGTVSLDKIVHSWKKADISIELGILRDFIQSKQETVDVESLKNSTTLALIREQEDYAHEFNEPDLCSLNFRKSIALKVEKCLNHLHKNGHLTAIPDDMVLVARDVLNTTKIQECERAFNRLYSAADDKDYLEIGKDYDILLYFFKSMIQASEGK